MDQDDQSVEGAGEHAGASAETIGPTPIDSAAVVMWLLAEHVPLALLADLVASDGPASQVILETEGLPDHAWWESGRGYEPQDQPAPEEDAPDPAAAQGGTSG